MALVPVSCHVQPDWWDRRRGDRHGTHARPSDAQGHFVESLYLKPATREAHTGPSVQTSSTMQGSSIMQASGTMQAPGIAPQRIELWTATEKGTMRTDASSAVGLSHGRYRR